MPSDELVIVGKLGRPRGLHGEIHVTPETDYPERFDGMDEIHVSTRDGWEILRIASTTMVGGRPVIKFENVDSPEEAARLTNRGLAVPKDQLVTLPEGEHFIFDLIGCEVVEQQSGERIGEVVNVEQYPANDVYVVRTTSESSLMVPAVSEFVKTIDIAAKRIIVDTTGLTDA
ncbi:MAG: 16S rRNA processing protein RimM [candidate division Zixibacteria bacterium]|nr:16S rRNA processing protein RimM [candidate division Zixibacteria bacterium]